MTYAIQAKGLTRFFGSQPAVQGVDLQIKQGSAHGFLGLNGAGKSTTIRMLCTLLRPSGGQASVAGHDVVERPLEVRRRIGVVGEEAAAGRPWWTPLEYCTYFASIQRLPDPQGAARTALDAVGIESNQRRRAIASLSTGLRRRVDLARALIGSPRVLFLDEPTRGLDLPGKRAVWDLLHRLVSEQRVTVFLSSHDVAEILDVCQELTVISRGHVVHRGGMGEWSASPRAFEQRLIQLLQT